MIIAYVFLTAAMTYNLKAEFIIRKAITGLKQLSWWIIEYKNFHENISTIYERIGLDRITGPDLIYFQLHVHDGDLDPTQSILKKKTTRICDW